MTTRPCMLIYDIPQRSGFPNPSPRLRRRGVRANLSCWVLPEGRIPYDLLDRMAEAGGSWHVVPFDPEAAGRVAEMALAALRREADQAVRRAMQSESRAAHDAEERGREVYVERVRRAVRRAEVLLGQLAEGAAALGLDFDPAGEATAIAQLYQASHARAMIYAQMRRQAQAAGLTQAAALAGADDVPGPVLADMLEEAGIEAAAGHEAFAGSAL